MFEGIRRFFRSKAQETSIEVLDDTCLVPLHKPRRSDTHKGDYGHVLVIGGDYGMPGAVRLAAETAYRVGAGLVSVVTRIGHIASIVSERPEIMVHGIENAEELAPLLKKATVIVLGPGLGQSMWSQTFYQAALNTNLPLLLDADALNLLAIHHSNRSNWVLTPHAGEASRLLSTTIKTIQAERIESVQALQKHFNGIAVLKGPGTLIAGPHDKLSRCDAGNPGMASGGMGDALTGSIAGLIAQGFDVYQSVCMGVYLHSHAADIVAAEFGQRGLLASDLIPVIRALVNQKLK